MKDRVPEIKKNALAVISGACFLVLCFVTFLNTYRMVLLEAEVEELKGVLQRSNSGNPLDGTISPNQFVTRKRRSAPNGDAEGAVGVIEEHETPTQNLSKRKFQAFKGVADSSDSSSLQNTISPNEKGAGRIVKKPILKSLDSSSYTSNEFNAGSSESEFPIIRDEEVVRRRSRPRMQILDERHPRTGRIKPLPSIHLSGDTSRYMPDTHPNFKGNGHLRHLQNIFVDWVPNSWVEKTGMMNHFDFDNGYLNIRESGLYLIYAQVYYLDEHDVNGYRVYKNDHIILQCTISLHSFTRAQKGNTCYTAGVEYVAEGDRISLGDILGGHYSVFEAGKSFFGAVKLGDVRARV